ncbi:uncharacterized protein F4807DRAFT_222134 [Annulohypoxylon truncatum]|uniref:uncharacterized protein n=1 Tax=Annulohypoxylon truncatum TaxID=327061 RepID=UPI0020086DAA|nr:uncharacterized protein F4807DRAFT_222134 [Annulohypoxylon truncatum]KAI1206747.1 hypothetical protein F4807DRAFT_222134 [Annulohypoxylon truncatum]
MTTQEDVNIESYTEYALGMTIFLTRLITRLMLVGFRGLYWDDLFTCVAIAFWTTDLVILYEIGVYGSSVGQTYESAALLDDAKVASLRIGDKLTFASWNCYICLIWSMKAVVLFYYDRLTMNLWQNKMARYIRICTLVTFCVAIIFQYTLCTPIELAWQVKPYPGDKCVFRRENYILFPILSIISDLGIMAIPLPLLWQVKIPVWRKLILGFLFGSGIFIIIATLLRTVYSLRSLLDLLVATQWATREYLVTAFVVSAPAIKPLFSKRLWGLRGSTTNSRTADRYGSGGSALRSGKGSKAHSHSVVVESQNGGNSGSSSGGKVFEMPARAWPSRKGSNAKIRLPSEASQEHFAHYSDEEAGIYVTETFTVSSEERKQAAK